MDIIRAQEQSRDLHESFHNQVMKNKTKQKQQQKTHKYWVISCANGMVNIKLF